MNSQSALQRLLDEPDGTMTPQKKLVWEDFDQIDVLVKKRISYRRISLALKEDGKSITASILKKHYEEIKRQRQREAKRSKQSVKGEKVELKDKQQPPITDYSQYEQTTTRPNLADYKPSANTSSPARPGDQDSAVKEYWSLPKNPADYKSPTVQKYSSPDYKSS